MSLLTEREWSVGYRIEDGNLIEPFYNPALACSVQYDRLTVIFPRFAGPGGAWHRGFDSKRRADAAMRLIVGLTVGPQEQRLSPRATTCANRLQPGSALSI